MEACKLIYITFTEIPSERVVEDLHVLEDVAVLTDSLAGMRRNNAEGRTSSGSKHGSTPCRVTCEMVDPTFTMSTEVLERVSLPQERPVRDAL